MFTLRQSLYIKGSAGDPLPTVWNSLDAKGTRFLRGQLCLICAAPGVGKSALVLTYALRARVPTLYLSADSDAFTQLSRSLSIMTGKPLEQSAAAVRLGELTDAEEQALHDIPIRFSYNASPTLDDIESSMLSYEEVYGDFPALVIADNVTNVRSGGDNEDDPFAGLEALMDYLHGMARSTSACVIGLHHVTGPYNDGDKPIPLGGIKGQIARVPEVVLTVHKPGPGTLGVSTVKNRSGRANPSGMDWVGLDFEGSAMRIADPT